MYAGPRNDVTGSAGAIIVSFGLRQGYAAADPVGEPDEVVKFLPAFLRDSLIPPVTDQLFTCIARIRAIASQISVRWMPFSPSASCVSMSP
jgi:hypothetical protein